MESSSSAPAGCRDAGAMSTHTPAPCRGVPPPHPTRVLGGEQGPTWELKRVSFLILQRLDVIACVLLLVLGVQSGSRQPPVHPSPWHYQLLPAPTSSEDKRLHRASTSLPSRSFSPSRAASRSSSSWIYGAGHGHGVPFTPIRCPMASPAPGPLREPRPPMTSSPASPASPWSAGSPHPAPPASRTQRKQGVINAVSIPPFPCAP